MIIARGVEELSKGMYFFLFKKYFTLVWVNVLSVFLLRINIFFRFLKYLARGVFVHSFFQDNFVKVTWTNKKIVRYIDARLNQIRLFIFLSLDRVSELYLLFVLKPRELFASAISIIQIVARTAKKARSLTFFFLAAARWRPTLRGRLSETITFNGRKRVAGQKHDGGTRRQSVSADSVKPVKGLACDILNPEKEGHADSKRPRLARRIWKTPRCRT